MTIITVVGNRIDAEKTAIVGTDGQTYTRYSFTGAAGAAAELRSRCAFAKLNPSDLGSPAAGQGTFYFEISDNALAILSNLQKGLGVAAGRAV